MTADPAPGLTVEVVAYGSPAPQGSKRFVGMRGGRAVLVESSKAVKPWREAVQDAVLYTTRIYGTPSDWPLAGPLAASMVFTLAKPVSAPKRRRTWPDRYPDLSKLVRATEDALTDCGLWEDDARVIRYDLLAKVFPGEDPQALDRPGVRISVRRLTPLEN